MIGLVRLALRRPYTMAIAAMLIVLMGFLSVKRMVVDIFPNIDIPVVYVAWNYPGLSAEDMERRVVLVSERAYSTTVNGIERIESLSIPGLGILKVYFPQGTDIGGAIAQITAQNNSILRIAPPGITPPNMIRFNASNVPVVQVTLNSKTLPEQQIFDYGLNFLRVRLFTIPGLSIPAPYGGKQRQIIVDVDPAKLSAKGLSQMDVVSALQTTNVIVPAGIARIGEREFNVKLNSSPQVVDQFQALPVGVRDGLAVMLGDVAKVSDSFATQQNAVRINGQRASYMPILKNSDASTITVVEAVRDLLPEIQATAPEGLELKLDFDQSVFVRGAVDNVVHEAILSSILVSLMILVFLGSWRNTVIVSLSIPLSIAAGLAGLFLTGQTINLMTLGGLALAIGLLVDNATVTIENIHRNQALGKPLTVAILDGSNEVIQPLTVATLAICIVFFPVLLLTGPSRFLFIPLAITVVLAMLASYVLSFTVVPALARYLLKDHDDHAPRNISARMSAAFDRGFERFQNAYGNVLAVTLQRRGFVLGCFALCSPRPRRWRRPSAPTSSRPPTSASSSCTCARRAARGSRRPRRSWPGREAHPPGDPGEGAAHHQRHDRPAVLAQSRLRAERQHQRHGRGAADLAQSRPQAVRGISAPDPREAQRRVPRQPVLFPDRRYRQPGAQLRPGGADRHPDPGPELPARLRLGAAHPARDPENPGRRRSAHRAGAGLPDPPDRRRPPARRAPRRRPARRRQQHAHLACRQRAGRPDLLPQSADRRELHRRGADAGRQDPVDRRRAQPAGQSGGPQHQSQHPADDADHGAGQPGDAHLRHRLGAADHQHAVDQPLHRAARRGRAANVDGRDLGGVAAEIKRVIAEVQKNLPSTVKIFLRGQNEVMETSFRNLGFGLILAIILVYALLVVLFQSWVDPFIIMMAVPGALVGILWTLAMTGTTINVASLMGAIMSVGIAVSNSILVVSFANDLRSRNESLTPFEAVIEAGKTRLRPILMTALAMIIGMIPMALALGEAGEQNAPLGRAVIGGLAFATFATLFLVPIFYTLLRRQLPTLHTLDKRFEAEAAGASTGGSAHG